ncbi:hypothetical protein BCR39DRAFT_321864 [Naematelia encephala]|uniref:Uncharacterized protein n=1 Tax=Naematelia encephala TaxID=71784 RepID=A0A1Y2AQI0_9TREE|nr:hypothetical protein BCR39DRAFT_321864 [Naematelia encephala]
MPRLPLLLQAARNASRGQGVLQDLAPAACLVRKKRHQHRRSRCAHEGEIRYSCRLAFAHNHVDSIVQATRYPDLTLDALFR